jgi:YD repeat-containing protein
VIGDYSYTAHGEASRTTPAGTTTYDYDVLGNLRYVMLVTLAGRSVTAYSTAARCVTMAYCAYCAARLASPVSPSASPNRYAHALEDSINLLGPDGLYPCDAAVDEEMLVVLASAWC